MKSKILILFSVLLLFAMAIPAHSAPRLKLPESVFNFGYTPQNSKISHSFWIHSTGTDSLKIIKVVPG